MKNIIKILSFIVLFSALVLDSFAIDAPTNLNLGSSTESSVNLSWDVTENAFMYYVYYSKQSGLETGYDMQTDFVESNSLQIDALETGTTYYFVVVALDENGDESIFSNEITIDITDSTTVTAIQTDFALDSIENSAYNKIKLTFTNNLDNSENTIREFKITNKNDNLDTFEVISTELDENNFSVLELTLDRETVIGEEYEVVIIAITSEDGKNIEYGIDNTETFIVVEIIEPIIELNSATDEPTGPSGENVEASEIENTTLSLAENNDSLPKTGPEHVLMLILSIILGALIFVFKYKKA